MFSAAIGSRVSNGVLATARPPFASHGGKAAPALSSDCEDCCFALLRCGLAELEKDAASCDSCADVNMSFNFYLQVHLVPRQAIAPVAITTRLLKCRYRERAVPSYARTPVR